MRLMNIRMAHHVIRELSGLAERNHISRREAAERAILMAARADLRNRGKPLADSNPS